MTSLKSEKQYKLYELRAYVRFDGVQCSNVDYNLIKVKTQNGSKSFSICVDSVFFNYLIKELLHSEYYRLRFLENILKPHPNVKKMLFILQPTKYDLIDHRWNQMVTCMVQERCQLDHALSWLSTLGGAFSALGDYYTNCAETAGKISFHQLRLAIKLQDPNVAARCRLYLSLSLIQQRRFRFARNLIRYEYDRAKNATVVDERLVKMCKGIWTKLQFEHELHRNNRSVEKLVNTCVKF